jgi:fused signal recognition particle receptor
MFSFFKKKPPSATPVADASGDLALDLRAPPPTNPPATPPAAVPTTLPNETGLGGIPSDGAPLGGIPSDGAPSGGASFGSPPSGDAPLGSTPSDGAPSGDTASGTALTSPLDSAAPFADSIAKPTKRNWLERLKAGLAKTSANLSLLFVGAKIGEELYEELEAALLMSDAGMEATQFLLDGLKRKVKEEKLLEAVQVKAALKSLLLELLLPLQKPFELGRHQPLVMMIAGVNGAGKTTTIGKLAKHLQANDQSVLLAAGDTFRAAAREQLAVWGQRNGVTVIAQESGDPAAVAFDAVASARAKNIDVVMVDTAGRLPTQLHLMEELKKIKRVIGKGMEGAPHEVLLVIDGNTGQNALAQVKAFDDALQLSGVVITKLDGTAKGGILAAIAKIRPVPVYFIGVGERIEDLQAFSAHEFVNALLGNE